jgi:hypothetical protein
LKPLNASEVRYLSGLESKKNVSASYVQRALGMVARGDVMPTGPEAEAEADTKPAIRRAVVKPVEAPASEPEGD